MCWLKSHSMCDINTTWSGEVKLETPREKLRPDKSLECWMLMFLEWEGQKGEDWAPEWGSRGWFSVLSLLPLRLFLTSWWDLVDNIWVWVPRVMDVEERIWRTWCCTTGLGETGWLMMMDVGASFQGTQPIANPTHFHIYRGHTHIAFLRVNQLFTNSNNLFSLLI